MTCNCVGECEVCECKDCHENADLTVMDAVCGDYILEDDMGVDGD